MPDQTPLMARPSCDSSMESAPSSSTSPASCATRAWPALAPLRVMVPRTPS
ncbi:hypothetical protein [Variovorax sp. E3]|uniref:hypothetical protein n=1 Tax=Variovorax sp. E3 TaxID=1914993 RepID=UPI0018DB3D65|nr:hypothetical protein [Variovorax sp. E3]